MAATAAPTMTEPQTNGASHPYTCNTCQVAFKGSELQRGHMQSDWHRYNLKRRVASLPPLTSEIFAEKVLANQASAAATAAKAQFEKTCAPCSRTYFSENAYSNHLQSQKHKLKLVELSRGPDVETEDGTESMASSAFSLGDSVATTKASEVDGDIAQAVDGLQRANLQDPEAAATTPEPQPSKDSSSTTTPSSESTTYPAEPILQCLFCNFTSNSITSNTTHMSRDHGLFIPEQSYLVDLAGLLSYLHERVHILHECLYCGQIKYTASGIQTHMRDKGHCMIAFESEEEMIEVGQFYDFRSTYSDDEESDEDSDSEDGDEATPRKKLGADRKATYDTADGDDEDWEEEDSDSDTAEDESKPGKPSPADPARLSQNTPLATDTTLHLPSGRSAGHRSLARYYRQNLHSYPTAAERLQQQKLLEDRPLDATRRPTRDTHTNEEGQVVHLRGRGGKEVVSRAGGGLGMIGAAEEKKKEARKLEARERKKAERAENRYRYGNERRGNNQKHFRDPLLQ